jgi:hypothetical protein
MLTRSTEQRKNLRRFTRRAATLSLDAQRPSVDCVIWDLSQGGARLAIALPLTELPHQFTLNVFRDGSVKRPCEVLWMNRRFVGVKFMDQVP